MYFLLFLCIMAMKWLGGFLVHDLVLAHNLGVVINHRAP